MKIEIRLLPAIFIVLIVISAVFALFKISGHRHQIDRDKLSTGLYRAQMEVKRYSVKVDSLTEYVAETDLIIVSRDKEIKRLAEEKARLKELNIKRINTIGKLNLRIEALMDSVPPSDTIIIKEDCDGEQGQYIKLPLSYSSSDRWVTQSAKVGVDGLGSLSFTMSPTPMKIILGTKKEGVFKTSPSAMVTTPNPYIQIDQSQFVVVDRQKPTWHYMAYGGAAGVALTLAISLLNK